MHGGLPAFSLVGLPDAAVRESRERVRAAVSNSGFEFPLHRITASLAPADLRKAGPGFDLAIAAALLAASGQSRPGRSDRYWLAGELALDGSITPRARGARDGRGGAPRRRRGDRGRRRQRGRGGAGRRADRRPAARPRRGRRARRAPSWRRSTAPSCRAPSSNGAGPDPPDLAELRGQPYLRHALEVAAAGGHSMLIVGPPGAGKSLAARRLPSLLPPLGGGGDRGDADRQRAVARRRPGRWPPARSARRTTRSRPRGSSAVATRRGRAKRRSPTAASCSSTSSASSPARRSRRCASRSRTGRSRSPAPGTRSSCRAGSCSSRRRTPARAGAASSSARCRCPEASVRRYEAKLSGALADRIDISLSVEQPPRGAARRPWRALGGPCARVAAARERQVRRLGAGPLQRGHDPAETRAPAVSTAGGRGLLARSHDRLGLSGRGYERVLRVARTLADLEGSRSRRRGSRRGRADACVAGVAGP